MDLITNIGTDGWAWFKLGTLLAMLIMLAWATRRTVITLTEFAWEGKIPKLSAFLQAAWPAAAAGAVMYLVLASYGPGEKPVSDNSGKAGNTVTEKQKKKEEAKPKEKEEKKDYDKSLKEHQDEADRYLDEATEKAKRNQTGIYITPEMEEQLKKGCTLDEIEYAYHQVTNWDCPPGNSSN